MGKPDLKKKLEAILFSIGDKIEIEELSRLTKEKDLGFIQHTLRELRDEYKIKESPIVLHEEGNAWKMNVHEEHMSTIRKVVKKMELSKTLLETLSVIAWKAPVKQSVVIAVRTNKAYDHLVELEKMGYITRKKFGRTKLVNLTEKFFSYFEINQKGGLNRIFKRVTDRAKLKYGAVLEKIENEEKEGSPLEEEGKVVEEGISPEAKKDLEERQKLDANKETEERLKEINARIENIDFDDQIPEKKTEEAESPEEDVSEEEETSSTEVQEEPIPEKKKELGEE